LSLDPGPWAEGEAPPALQNPRLASRLLAGFALTTPALDLGMLLVNRFVPGTYEWSVCGSPLVAVALRALVAGFVAWGAIAAGGRDRDLSYAALMVAASPLLWPWSFPAIPLLGWVAWRWSFRGPPPNWAKTVGYVVIAVIVLAVLAVPCGVIDLDCSVKPS
jgi:hypothetical protein